jgi:hypothetical protein
MVHARTRVRECRAACVLGLEERGESTRRQRCTKRGRTGDVWLAHRATWGVSDIAHVTGERVGDCLMRERERVKRREDLTPRLRH